MSDIADELDASEWDSADDEVFAAVPSLRGKDVSGLLLRYFNHLDVPVDVAVYGTTENDATYRYQEWHPDWELPQELECGATDISGGEADFDELIDPFWHFIRVGVTPSGDETPSEGSFKLAHMRRFGDDY